MVLRPPLAERFAIEGPAGALQTLLEIPRTAAGAAPERVPAFGVVCHPHPLHGGTLDNKVVYTLARAFQQLGAPALRFNFRGVGASAGSYAQGEGELEDARAVIAWGRQRFPGAPLWLGGFSFGGAVAALAAGGTDPARVVLVAPGVRTLDIRTAAAPACPWLIVQGDADEVVPAAEVLEWARGLAPPPEVTVLPGAGHFFHGRINELREAVLAFLNAAETAGSR
ncbi:MAG: alpha/beta fold hydrolase [Gammaproteobacteria bacterium]|nr:alpha/beta fold hydrolase [Gammaproteobacteria bacterium]